MEKEIIIAQIPTSEYIAQYRDVDKFIEFCKKCNNYKRVWSCPPFGADICRKVNDLERYSITTVIGVKINLDETLQHKPTTIEERNSLIQEILHGVRMRVDAALLPLEQVIQPSRLYYAGSCRLCMPEACNRAQNEACRYPDKMRSTLEAVGFDMGLTTSNLLGIEMKWCDDLRLPPYFTLVYGLLSNDSTIELVKGIFNGMSGISSVKFTTQD